MAPLRTLPDALAEAAQSGEGYVFIGRGAEVRRSYAEMHDQSQRAAAAFQARGLRQGDLVALIVDDAEPFLTALFGASMAGIVPVSLYPPATSSDRRRYLDATAAILRNSRARAIVTTSGLAADFEGLRSTCRDLEMVISIADLSATTADLKVCTTTATEIGIPTDAEVVQAFRPAKASDADREVVQAFRPAGIALDDIAFVQFTSGSTSAPKGIAITHRSLAANIDAINGPAGLASSSSDSAMSWLPLYHDMGLVGMALGAMYCARPAVLMAPQAFVKRPADWLRAISRHRATISFAPSFAYDLCARRITARDLEGLDLSCWRVAGCGGEPIHVPSLAAFAEKLRGAGFRETSFLPSYGLAEHVLAVTFAPRGRPLRVEHLSVDELATRAVAIQTGTQIDGASVVSCGPALPGHRIRIVGENGDELPDCALGEITLAGPSVMKGYFGDDALTAQTIREGWLHTGDVGYVSEGELFVCGRIKDIVIANGRKYHPQDLEWAVDDLAGIRRGRVVAFATRRVGLADRVVVVLEPSGAVEAGVLTQSIRQRIADVCGVYADEILLVPSGTIGRTTSGKVQRLATRTRYERGELMESTKDKVQISK
jgi:fatty-acyl-CoA synthase